MKPQLWTRLTLAAIAAVLLTATSIGPAGAETKVLSLNDCLAIAAKGSWSVLKAEEDIAQSEWQLRQARTEKLPKLSTSYSYAYLSPKNEIIIGGNPVEVGYQDNYSWNIKATQPLFQGFKILTNEKLKELGLDISQIALAQAKQELALSVKQAYYQVLAAQKNAQVAAQAVRQLESQVNVAENFYQVGMIPKNDLLQVQVDLADQKQTLVLAENSVDLAKANLNTVMRRDVRTPLEIQDVLDVTPTSANYQEALKKAYSQRPELLQALRGVDQAEQAIKLAKGDYYPTVNFSATYERDRDDWFVWGAGDAGNRESSTFAINLSWTFWEWNKTRYAVAEQTSAMIKAKHTVRQLKDGIALEIRSALLDLEAARKNIGAAKLAVTQAEENYRISEERYKEQVTTSTEVLDAQTRLSQAQSNYYSSLYNYHLALAQLKRYMGEM